MKSPLYTYISSDLRYFCMENQRIICSLQGPHGCSQRAPQHAFADSFQNSDFKFQIPHLRFQISHSKLQTLDLRFQIPDSRLQIPDSRLQTSGCPVFWQFYLMTAVFHFYFLLFYCCTFATSSC